MDEVSTYLAAWRESADRVLALCDELGAGDWSAQSDCPGWAVRDVLAHLAHLEGVLADGRSGPAVPGLREVPPEWTNAGVDERRDRSPRALRAELADAVLRRSAELDRLQPIDPRSRSDASPAGVGWDWGTLLRNRAIDLWVHEQDIRRAVRAPGAMAGVSAQVVVRTFASSLPYVLGKKVAPPAGTVVRWRVHGPVEADRTLCVDATHRAVPAEPGSPTSARLDLDTETFTLLAAGRRDPGDVEVAITGDEDLAAQVMAAMALTP